MFKKLFNNVVNHFKKPKTVDDIAFELAMKDSGIKPSYNDEIFYRYMFFIDKDRDYYLELAKTLIRKEKINNLKDKINIRK